MAENWLKLADVSPNRVTPMLRQYMQAKTECADSLLFFRMGDFYELFFEDAVEAADVLGLTLTSRDGQDKKGQRIPMAGVPVRAVESYLARIIKAGRTVTICDQVEDPKEAKGIVRRAVTRTITPGTVIEPELLDEGANNYLGAVVMREKKAGLAFIDVSTGEFLAAQVDSAIRGTLADEFTRMAPAEVLVCRGAEAPELDYLRKHFGEAAHFTERPELDFDPQAARELLMDAFGVATLKGMALEDAPEATAAAGAVLAYVHSTQREMAPHVQTPRRYSPAGYVVLDGNTQRNLELVESLADKKKRGALLGVLDRTLTSMGGRMLRHWVVHPLIDGDAIRRRLGGVETFVDDNERRIALRDRLKGVADLERLLSRITSKTANARDVQALGSSLARIPDIREAIEACEAPLLTQLHQNLDPLADVAGGIARAIVDEPPALITEADIFKDGYNEELDNLRDLVRGGRDWIATLKKEESERTGIPNLKIGYNKVFGYYIEVSKAHVGKAPEDYQRKQTLVNAERYITPALKAREEEMVTAQERMQKLEYDLFIGLRNRIAQEARRIQQTATAAATLDVLLSLAEVAVAKVFCKPVIDDGNDIVIRDGRHPVVEDLMPRGDFVPNDTVIEHDTAALQIVTGPNMAGKSTYLRQVALIVLMAQMGAYVPAAEAKVGVVDRIFTRVGASDNLVRGESTFMVEMIESANILNTATERSLIVLDEIGRGTSTFDGISIAWSVAEHIHDHIHANTLFATHYHELTELGEKLERAKNLNVAVREWGEKVVFLYRIVDGGADHSYGIQVAKLAGLPDSVVRRARAILDALESGNQSTLGLPQQMYLFGPAQEAKPSEVEEELKHIVPDELSPKEAHEFVCHLKHLLNNPRA
ncbi:MAG: DNA mismatch repair protein MutS [Candidatus Hydrogenedentota bacterium]